MKSISSLQTAIGKWSTNAFGNERTALPVIKHLKTEADELLVALDDWYNGEDPEGVGLEYFDDKLDKLSWGYADILICLLDSANRLGLNIETILGSSWKKLDKIKEYKWVANGDDYEHVMDFNDSDTFLQRFTQQILRKDKLHHKRIIEAISVSKSYNSTLFEELLAVVGKYYLETGIDPEEVADDYLDMVLEMRAEYVRFLRTGEYSCKSQAHASKLVYSAPHVMEAYMNSLMISQLVWSHHFKMLDYFYCWIAWDGCSTILDVGSGHGLYSYLIKKKSPNYRIVDIVDISSSSLKMTEKVLGNDRVRYYKSDITRFKNPITYDLIIMGEVLEHLDDPLYTLQVVQKMLNKGGLIWLTVPTNAPAIDHIFLFKNPQEIYYLVSLSGLTIIDTVVCESGDEGTELVGLFCTKK